MKVASHAAGRSSIELRRSAAAPKGNSNRSQQITNDRRKDFDGFTINNSIPLIEKHSKERQGKRSEEISSGRVSRTIVSRVGS